MRVDPPHRKQPNRPPLDFSEILGREKELHDYVLKKTGKTIQKHKNYPGSGNGIGHDPLNLKPYIGTATYRNGDRPPFIYQMTSAIRGFMNKALRLDETGIIRSEGREGCGLTLCALAEGANILEDLVLTFTGDDGFTRVTYTVKKLREFAGIGLRRFYRWLEQMINLGYLEKTKNGALKIGMKLLEELGLVEKFKQAKRQAMNLANQKAQKTDKAAEKAQRKEASKEDLASEMTQGRANRAAGKLPPPEQAKTAGRVEKRMSKPTAVAEWARQMKRNLIGGDGETGPP